VKVAVGVRQCGGDEELAGRGHGAIWVFINRKLAGHRKNLDYPV
jgi:hypothetical protein